MLKIENLSKSYGTQALFDDVTIHINKGERVGLVGRNGHGKTTLLKILSGEEAPDTGAVTFPKAYRVGYLKQQLRFTSPTVLQVASEGLSEDEKQHIWKAEKILEGLGFSTVEMGRSPETFSGGYQVRLNLARLLVSEPELLLLDEPTNFLDIVAIRWLEKFLLTWSGEMIVVTHDRSFMDTVTTHILGIHRQKVRKIAGTTGKYYEQIAAEEEVHEKSRINLERKRKQTEQFIRKFRAKARLVGLVQSRIKTLEKQKVPERLREIPVLDFSFKNKPFEAKMLMEVRDLSYRWSQDQPELFSKLKLSIGRGDRIAVIGPNGKGKSTFLRVLAEELDATSGEISRHHLTCTGFFGQTNVARLEPNRNVVEELLAADSDRSLGRARSIAGAMMFEGDAALKKISVLSGGEKSRVLLGKLLLSPHNLLLLDEPTNHLDMDSSEALLNALEEFEGAVVIVTHNEMFLHNLAEKLLVFDRGGAFIFDGSYENFLDEVGWEGEEERESVEGGKWNAERSGCMHEVQSTDEERKATKRESRKERARIQQEKAKELNPIKDKIKKLESTVSEMELRIETVNRNLVEASTSGDGELIAALSKELNELNTRLEGVYQELFEATEELEEKEMEWEKKLSADN